MSMLLNQYSLSLMIALPLAGAFGLLCCRSRWWSLVMCVVGAGSALLMGVFIIISLRHVGGLEFSQHWPWIPSWGVSYWVAVDGLSFYLLLVTLVLLPLALFIEAGSGASFRQRAFFLLIFEASLLGSYIALDLLLFLSCLELATLSLFFYVGSKNKEGKAALGHRFLLLNLIGSGFLLMVFLAFYRAGDGTTLLATLMQNPLPPVRQTLWCGIFIAGIAIKGALLPWHAWCRDVEARLDPGLLITVNGLFLPLAAYTMIRFVYSLLPYGFFKLHSIFFMLAAVSLVLTCFWAWGARERKTIPAYVSLAIYAWVFVGMSTMSRDAIVGALYLMGQHAWIMALLAVVLVLNGSKAAWASRGTVLLSTLVCLALIAVPGSGAFVSLMLIAAAAFREQPYWIVLAMITWISLGGLLLRERSLIFKAMAASSRPQRRGAWVIGLVLTLVIVWGGFRPQSILQMMGRDGDAWLARLKTVQDDVEGNIP